MSSAIKYYNSHKEEVLKYKKEYYYNKNKKYSFFKKIKIKGYTKKESNTLIKTAIDLDRCKILFSYGDEFKTYTHTEFMELYKFKDFSLIEIETYIKQYDKEVNDWKNVYCENCDEVTFENIMIILFEKGAEIVLNIYENQIIKN